MEFPESPFVIVHLTHFLHILFLLPGYTNDEVVFGVPLAYREVWRAKLAGKGGPLARQKTIYLAGQKGGPNYSRKIFNPAKT